MSEDDYRQILENLASALNRLMTHRPEWGEADIRVRHLLGVTISEAQRRMRDLSESASDPAIA